MLYSVAILSCFKMAKALRENAALLVPTGSWPTISRNEQTWQKWKTNLINAWTRRDISEYDILMCLLTEAYLERVHISFHICRTIKKSIWSIHTVIIRKSININISQKVLITTRILENDRMGSLIFGFLLRNSLYIIILRVGWHLLAFLPLRCTMRPFLATKNLVSTCFAHMYVYLRLAYML